MEKKNDAARRPLSFVKHYSTSPSARVAKAYGAAQTSPNPNSAPPTPSAPSTYSASPTPSAPSTYSASPTPSAPSTYSASPTPNAPSTYSAPPTPNASPTPPPIWAPEPTTPPATLPNTLTAATFRACLATAAANVSAPVVSMRCDGEDATVDVASLRALVPNDGGWKARRAALEQAFQGLQNIAAFLGTAPSRQLDGELFDAWARFGAAVGATSEARLDNLATQAGELLNIAIPKLSDEKLILARFAYAALRCQSGELGTALAILNAVAASRWIPPKPGTDAQSFLWRRWQTVLETRDLLAALARRTGISDIWRERGNFFRDLASTGSISERLQAYELWRATECYGSDLSAAEAKLRRSAYGNSVRLNREAGTLYAKTFGVVPKPSKEGGRSGCLGVAAAATLAALAFGWTLDKVATAARSETARCSASVEASGEPFELLEAVAEVAAIEANASNGFAEN